MNVDGSLELGAEEKRCLLLHVVYVDVHSSMLPFYVLPAYRRHTTMWLNVVMTVSVNLGATK